MDRRELVRVVPMALTLQRKITIGVLVLYWPALFVSAHVPIPRLVRDADVSDKALHFLAYLVLTFLLWLAVIGDKKVCWRRPAAWCILLFVAGYGVADELLQGLVAGRTCDVQDFFMDLAGMLTALLLLSFFTSWPAAFCVAAILIFGITNAARANVADLLPVASALFYLFAYAVLTLLWVQSLKLLTLRRDVQRITIRWFMLALAVPLALLLAVKLASVFLDRTFVIKDMLISAVGIGAAVVSTCLAPLFRRAEPGAISYHQRRD
ncbi:MAG: VanZ family protein [Sedimentisphaerales bacterium]